VTSPGGPRALICDFGGVIAQATAQRMTEAPAPTAAERLLIALEVEHGMLDYVRTVRARGWRTALLTNNAYRIGPEWRAKVPDLKAVFHVVVDALVAGVRKPERAAYELTLDALGVAAEECIFVDDVEANCLAAAELGMHAVCFRSVDQAIREIEEASLARA